MLSGLSSLAHGLVQHFGIWGVLVAMILESVGVPLPSEVTLPLGALAVAGRGDAALVLVAAAGTVGNVLGSALAYAIGAAAGRGWRGARWLHPQRWEAAQRWFARRGDAAVLLGRLLPVVRTYISFPAGAAAMPLGRFLAYTAAGSALWCAALTIAGAALGANWTRLVPLFSWLTAATVLAVLLALAAAALLWLRRRASG